MPTYSYNGKKITSPTPLTDEQLEEAFSEDVDINTGSNVSGSGATKESRGGGFGGRFREDVSGIVDLAKELPGLAINPTGTGMGMINRMIEGTSEQIKPFLPQELPQGGNLMKFLGQDPLKGAQAGLAAIPGIGRTVQSGQDLSEGKPGAGGELAYDTLMALSPKIAPKVNSLLDVGIDAVDTKVGKLGSALEQNAVTRLDDISDMPKPGVRGLLSDPDLWKKRILAGGAAGLVGADPSTMLGVALAPDMVTAAKTSPTIARGQAGLGRMLAGPNAPMPRRRYMSEIETGDYENPIGPQPSPNRVALPEELWQGMDETPVTQRINPPDLGNFEPIPYEKLPNIGKSPTRRVPGEDIPSASHYSKIKRLYSRVTGENSLYL